MELPAIRGYASVSLTRIMGTSFDLDTGVPANTTAIIYLPKIAGSYMILVDGKPVENIGSSGPWVVVSSTSGNHSFEVQKK